MSKLQLKQQPTLRDIQDYCLAMAKERGFYEQTVPQSYLLLVEEVGELAKCVRKSHAGMGIDVDKKYELDAAGEIGDILIVLSCVANQMGIDMEQAFRDKEEANKLRVWKA